MPDTVILGGGIIGLSTAYYLAKLAREADGPQHTIHVVEPCPQLFASASGKAGGFIAKDWFNPAMAPLGDLSFELHRQLALANDGRARWGWSESISYSLDRNASLVASDSDYDSDDAVDDLDSDPEPDPDPEPLSLDSPAVDGEDGKGAEHEHAHSAYQHRHSSVDAPDPSGEARSTGVEEEPDWLYNMTRLPMIEQKTAEAFAAAAAKEETASEVESNAEGENETATDAKAKGKGKAKANIDAETAEDDPPEAEADVAEKLAKLDHPFWLRTPSHAAQAISDRQTTGQINPLQLCEFLLEECIEMGVRLHHPARAAHLFRADESNPSSRTMIRINLLTTTSTGRELRTGTLDLPCDSLVLAAGCWTPDVFNGLFSKAPRAPVVQGLAGYSVVIRSKHWQPPDPTAPDGAAQMASPCHAIFTSDPSGFSPEIYSRLGGDLWLGGLNSGTMPLPARAMDAKPDPDAVERILAFGRELCGEDIEVVETGVCFRPIPPSGKPTIARMSDEELGRDVAPRAGGLGVGGGVFLATGHGPWGISLCLGTGMVLSEMIVGREPSADISGLTNW